MRNPSSERGYWQEPDRESPRGARSGNGNGPPAGNGWDSDYGNGNGYSGTGRHGGANGRGDDGYGRGDGYDGNGRHGGGSNGSNGRHGDGGNGGYPGRDDYLPREGHRFTHAGRAARGGGDGQDRTGGTGRSRASQLGADLRSRLGLSSGDNGNNGYGGDNSGDSGYGGDNGYSEPRGYGRGYRDTGGRRGATGLRDRATSRFTEAPSRGGRRARGYAGGGSGDGTDGRVRVRRKGDWWRRWTLRKAIFVVLGTGAGLAVLAMLAVVYAYEQTPIPTAVSEVALQQSSTVYFSNGKTQVGTFTAHGIDRQLLQSNQIPVVMKNAMVAAEDRNFYNEGGISTTGILRAAYTDLRGGDYAQGGSTLTQQFVRNYFATIGTQQTLGRKIKEIFVSVKLAKEKSKDWVLTQYLNTVPFGNNAYGVAAASETYFGEPALKLTVSQAAMLAAMPNQPSFFNPNPSAGAGYKALVARWQYVLGNMVRDGNLTQAQASAQKFPSVLPSNVVAAGWTGYKGYIMQAVQKEMKSLYGLSPQQLDSDGLRIVTTINPNMMNGLQNAVGRQEQAMRRDGRALPWYAHVGAMLEQPGGAILAFYGGPGLNLSPAQCQRLLCYDNTAMQDREQVGSSFKPYVLATAVSEGMNVQNSILDAIEPMCIPPDMTEAERLELSTVNMNCPSDWFPVNIQGENGGAMSVTKAAAQSSDPAFEDLIHRAGTQSTINMAKAFGVDPEASGLQAQVNKVGLALGIGSLTVEEQATTFATLDNGGMYVTPHMIAQITRSDGSAIPLKLVHRQVLTAVQAADVDDALSQDTEPGGTAYPGGLLSPQRPTIGKTGTTDQAESAFFIGAIPNYSLAVGIFTNEQDSKNPDQCASAGVNSNPPCGQTLNILPAINNQSTGGFGGAWPTSIWADFMQHQFGNAPVANLPSPDFAGFAKWDQVGQQKQKPKKNNPGQNQNGGCPPGDVRFHGHCFGPSPSPSPSNPFPTPSPSQSTFPPGGGGGGGGGGPPNG